MLLPHVSAWRALLAITTYYAQEHNSELEHLLWSVLYSALVVMMHKSITLYLGSDVLSTDSSGCIIHPADLSEH